MTELQTVPLSAIRTQVDEAVRKSAEHCDAQIKVIRTAVDDVKAHTERRFDRELTPIRDAIKALKRTAEGSGDHEMGLVRKLDGLLSSEREMRRRVDDMEQVVKGDLREVLNELREEVTMRHRRTPGGGTMVEVGRDGTLVEVGNRPHPVASDEAGSTFKFTLPKKLWPVLAAVALGGPAGVASVISLLTQAPQSAVTVAAEGVVTMQDKAAEELDRAQRIAAEAEAKAASIVAEANAKAARTMAEAEARAARERAVRPPPVQVAPEPTTE